MSSSVSLSVGKIFQKIFGSRNQRVLKRMSRTVGRINELEESVAALSDAGLAEKTNEFRQRLGDEVALDELLVEAFAVVREAAKRTVNMRHFDVQLIGGMVLHEGQIAEMRTGEGKTLVATLPAYLNALTGNGVHIVTVNDYLARRDAEWMGAVYSFLGMRTGVIVPGLNQEERQLAYSADVVYGTNNEFGFDYLRDNMVFTTEERVQGPLSFAIVDEVDSILIDEARTPLIISGATEDRTDVYVQINKLIPRLTAQQEEDGPGDYSVDEKVRQVYLTESGHENVEKLLSQAGMLKAGESLYAASNIALMHHVNAALRAHAMYQRDVDYVVNDGEVVIVDEFTGRTMPGRRWSEGLHQAIEAKETVSIQHENQTLASITFQNYFRLSDKLAGMTGTADTEAFEFQQIYGLEVVVIPTDKTMIRDDMGDLVYLTKDEKFVSIIDDIRDCMSRNQPVLVGTTSIETSEYLSELLNKQALSHQVLNAKFHEKEAHIITQAGRPGTVTVATNMAGRGTDIVLGGSLEAEIKALSDDAGQREREQITDKWQERHDKVVAAGGLHIIGTERHESRRIDNQLRGRSGRQGDPGSSRFYLSLEDDLMRIFASERVAGLMQKLGMEDGEAIEHPWVSKAIENAQRKVEAHNFDIRKNLLEFDNVANDQRKVIYEQRRELMDVDDISESIAGIRHDVVYDLIDNYIVPNSFDEQWDVPGLKDAIEHEFNEKLSIETWLEEDDNLHEETLREKIVAAIEEAYKQKAQLVGETVFRTFERQMMLQLLDTHWKEHLAAMDHLRQGIHLRGYAQKNPKQEYKREAFQMFAEMLDNIKRDVVGIVSKVQVREEDVEEIERQRQQQDRMQFNHAAASNPMGGDSQGGQPDASAAKAPFVRSQRKVGRNEPCPCGSGKKYKQCHGKLN